MSPTTPSELTRAIAAIDDLIDMTMGAPFLTCGCDTGRIARMRTQSDNASINRLVRGLVPIGKALDPTDQDDFVQVIARVSERMRRAAHNVSAEEIARAMRVFSDVDWADAPARLVSQRIRQATALLPRPSRITRAVLPIITSRLGTVARRTRANLITALGLARVEPSFGRIDNRVLSHMTSSQALFVTDAMTGRNERWSAQARSIVRGGLEQGLGTDAISARLRSALGAPATLRRQANYWDVIATVFSNRARTFAHLSSLRDGGINEYTIEAIMDEATSIQCRLLHGKTFKVEQALARYTQVQQAPEPEAVRELMPWIRSRRVAGQNQLYVPRPGGAETIIADEVRTGAGRLDDPGTFRNVSPTDALASIGVLVPPFHAMCRTTIVANI